MRKIDSDALRTVETTLGIGRPASLTPEALFDDGVLQQVFDVSGSIRRGVSPPAQEGIWTVSLRHEHPGANGIISTVYDPYTSDQTCAGTAITGAAWPNPIPRGLDVWIIAATAFILTGGAPANFKAAYLEQRLPATSNAFTCTAPLGEHGTGMQMYDDAVELLTGTYLPLLQVGSGEPGRFLGIRLPRGGKIRWRTENQNATAIDIQVNIVLGLMGAGLGQDAF